MLLKSTIASQLSGSADGITASRNRYGRYFRARTLPVNPSTPSQVRIRAAFTDVAERWPDLTSAQRAAWKVYADATPITNRIGDDIVLAANAMFARCGVPRARFGPVGAWNPTAAPAQPGLASLTLPTAVVLDIAGGNLEFSITQTDGWASSAGGYLFVFLSQPQSAGTNFYKGPFQHIGRVAGASTPPAAAQLLPFTPVPFTAAGQVGFARFIATDTNQRLSVDHIVRFISE